MNDSADCSRYGRESEEGEVKRREQLRSYQRTAGHCIDEDGKFIFRDSTREVKFAGDGSDAVSDSRTWPVFAQYATHPNSVTRGTFP
jgi:hypothetical protein